MNIKSFLMIALTALVMVACGGEEGATTEPTDQDSTVATDDTTATETTDNGAATMEAIMALREEFVGQLTEEEKTEVTRLQAIFQSMDHDAMMANQDSMMSTYADDMASALAIADAHPEPVAKALELMAEAHGEKACGPDCSCDKCKAKADGDETSTCGADCTCDKCKAKAEGGEKEACGPGCACDHCAAKADGHAHGHVMANMTEEEKTNMMKVHFVLGAMGHGHGHSGHDHGDHAGHDH